MAKIRGAKSNRIILQQNEHLLYLPKHLRAVFNALSLSAVHLIWLHGVDYVRIACVYALSIEQSSALRQVLKWPLYTPTTTMNYITRHVALRLANPLHTFLMSSSASSEWFGRTNRNSKCPSFVCPFWLSLISVVHGLWLLAITCTCLHGPFFFFHWFQFSEDTSAATHATKNEHEHESNKHFTSGTQLTEFMRRNSHRIRFTCKLPNSNKHLVYAVFSIRIDLLIVLIGWWRWMGKLVIVGYKNQSEIDGNSLKTIKINEYLRRLRYIDARRRLFTRWNKKQSKFFLCIFPHQSVARDSFCPHSTAATAYNFLFLFVQPVGSPIDPKHLFCEADIASRANKNRNKT